MPRPTLARFAATLRPVRRKADVSDTDHALLARFVKSRDEAAFRSLVNRHAKTVLAACRQVLTDPADVDDAFQATFLVLLKKAKALDAAVPLGGWLFAVAHRVAVRCRSDKARRSTREAEAAKRAATTREWADTPLQDVSWREAAAVLHDELNALPDKYRLPLLLCSVQGLTRDEAAEQLGTTVGAVRGQLERGRTLLERRLVKRGVVLSAGLLAVLVGSSSAAGGPPAGLIDLAVGAVTGNASSSVAALAHGAFPMTTTLKRIVLPAVFALGLLGAGAGLTSQVPTVNADDKNPAEMTKPKADAKADAKPAEVKERIITGTVLGTDGKPAAGVKLFSPRLKVARPRTEDDVTVDEVGKTDATGRFRVTLSESDQLRTYLIAHAAGAGMDWAEDPSGEVTLRLVPDAPITGRVLNTEGKPVRGVEVSVASVYVPKDGDLDAYLKGWLTNLRDTMSTPVKRLYLSRNVIAGGATTDADGRFRLTGMGKDRIVYVRFEGAGLARTQPMVITRPGLDTGPYEAELLKKEHDALRVLNRFKGPLPPDLTFVAEPGRTLEGTVTDPAGKPVAGATVGCSTGWGDGVEAVTDAAGKYRLDGLAKSTSGYTVRVQPPENSGLLSSSSTALDSDGVGPVQLDAKLAKGVVVTGRVTDKQTGKGVQAGVRLAPLPDNKHFAATPGSDGYRRNRTMQSTDADGRFRLVTIPGRSLLLVQAHAGEKFNGRHLNPYRTAEPEPEHKDLFRHDPDDGWIATTADNSFEFLDNEHAVKVVDLKETGETSVDLTVDRGTTGRVEVRGPDGRPLAGAYLAGMTDSWPVTYKLPEAAATVYALDPARPRTVAVYHLAKNLAGMAVVRGDEKEAVVVTLAETATVTGRLMDEDGAPLAGAEITVNAHKRVFSELYRFALNDAPKVVTDANGAFALPGVVPGMSFHLQIRKGDRYYGGKPKIGLLDLKAGETKALGDRTVESLR